MPGTGADGMRTPAAPPRGADVSARMPGAWPLLGHIPSLARDPMRFVSSLAEHGEMVKVRIGRQEMWFATSTRAVRQLLVTDARFYTNGRQVGRLADLFGDSVVRADGARHREQRRLVQPAFHEERFTGYVDVMRHQVETLVERWRPGQLLDLRSEMYALAVRVLLSAMFGAAEDQGTVEHAARCVPVILDNLLLRAVMPPWLAGMPLPANLRYARASSTLRRLAGEACARHRADGRDHRDLLSILLAAHPDDDRRVTDEAVTILIAGTDANATQAAWLFHELSEHPVAARRLRAEVDQVLGDRPITHGDVAKLVYTGQVVTETLRLHAPLMIARRATAPVELCGVAVEPGTEVLCSPYALHRREENFPEPLRFDPDRWQEERPAPAKSAFCTFGDGVHRCLGEHFARAELVVTVATVTRRHALTPAGRGRPREVAAALPRPDAVPMVVSARS
ncbi:cytochrome P450 [Streptomyces griseocarneus]|nr:cytochrome P450 [Streptomyces griseocarneus]